MKNRTRRVRPSGCPACARRAPPTTLRTWCAEHGEKGARLLLEYDDYRRGVDDVMRVQNTWRGGNARADIDGKRGRPAAHLRLRRRRRREEKRIRKRARLAHHTSPRVIQHTAFVPPAHSSSTRPPSRYVTPRRSTREMSIRAAAPNRPVALSHQIDAKLICDFFIQNSYERHADAPPHVRASPCAAAS